MSKESRGLLKEIIKPGAGSQLNGEKAEDETLETACQCRQHKPWQEQLASGESHGVSLEKNRVSGVSGFSSLGWEGTNSPL